MEGDCEKENAEILGKIIFHLSEAFKLFNDLQIGMISEIEQQERRNTVKLCKGAIRFIKGKLMAWKRFGR